MLFVTANFFLFFCVVFITYWFLLQGRLRLQNLFLLLASYFFYGCWDWRFLALLAFSTWLDFFTGIKISDATSKEQKRAWLLGSVLTNLGFLGFFKYYNFFTESFAQLLQGVGFQANMWTLNIILPVGISFYTFHGLSYVFDIYNGRIQPNRNVVDYSLFVSFFPLLVAGPIERATHLLPQVSKPRRFDYTKAIDGSRQILWGFFKKLVIADNCAPIVNQIFGSYENQSSAMLILGVVLFAFQIYGDFSGYSDIALGVSRLLGFELLKNFNFPYFSKSMSELWRKWHMSLSTWTNDYIFLQIIKKKTHWGRWGIIYGLLCTFSILGLWHGANWTFVAFGLFHGTVVSTEYYLQKQIRQKNKWLNNSTISGFTGWLLTMVLWLIGMIFFRSTSISDAFGYIKHVVSAPLLPASISTILNHKHLYFFIFMLMGIEWINRNKEFGFDIRWVNWRPLRWLSYYLILYILLRYSGSEQDFIYFQF